MAGKLAFRTFCRNIYLLDRYFGLTIVPLEKQESSNLETSEFAEKYFSYSSLDASLEDFTLWLRELTGSEKFIRLKQEFLQIQTRLKTESDSELRHYLVERSCQMEDEF